MFTAAEVARATFWRRGRKSAGGERGNVALLRLVCIYYPNNEHHNNGSQLS